MSTETWMSKCAAAGSSRPKVHDVSKSSARALTAKCLADSSLNCEASFIRLTLTERGWSSELMGGKTATRLCLERNFLWCFPHDHSNGGHPNLWQPENSVFYFYIAQLILQWTTVTKYTKRKIGFLPQKWFCSIVSLFVCSFNKTSIHPKRCHIAHIFHI